MSIKHFVVFENQHHNKFDTYDALFVFNGWEVNSPFKIVSNKLVKEGVINQRFQQNLIIAAYNDLTSADMMAHIPLMKFEVDYDHLAPVIYNRRIEFLIGYLRYVAGKDADTSLKLLPSQLGAVMQQHEQLIQSVIDDITGGVDIEVFIEKLKEDFDCDKKFWASHLRKQIRRGAA